VVARRAGPAGSTASAAPTPRHQVARIAGALPPIFPTVFPSSTSLFAITVSPATTEVWYPARHSKFFGSSSKRSSRLAKRRNWPEAFKRQVVAETLEPGSSVSDRYVLLCRLVLQYAGTGQNAAPNESAPDAGRDNHALCAWAHLTSARLYHSETGIASSPRYPRGNPFGPSFARSAFVTSPLGPISTPCRRHYSANPGDFDVVAFDLCNSFIVAHSCPPKEKTRTQPSGGIGQPGRGQR
jgi:hypothetical protein